MRYTVSHRYQDIIDGERFDLAVGQVVELDELTAAKVERNSPGTLVPENPAPAPSAEPESEPNGSAPVLDGDGAVQFGQEDVDSPPPGLALTGRRGRPRKVRQ